MGGMSVVDGVKTFFSSLPFEYNDGGRADAGYRGDAGDCVTRAISIAAEMPYQEVYDGLKEMAKRERPRKGSRRSSPRDGVGKATIVRYLESLGWEFWPTMAIGSGCTTHLREGELPMGNIICSVSKHYVAVIGGTIHDTHDCSRGGMRCVYGYWKEP